MSQRFISVLTVMVLAVIAMQARRHDAQSATFTMRRPAAWAAEFAASTEKTFDQLMAEAMSVMHKAMHGTAYTGDPDRDFVTMMIPHHEGAIDMAKVLLLYGKDEQVKRLAQEIIADQQNEVQLMKLWLVKHPAAVSTSHPMVMQK